MRILHIRPITLKDANRFVAQHHRHNVPVTGNKFSVSCLDGDRICGVAIAGRPVSRMLDDGLTLEILRVCTDGTHNACSILYGACSKCGKSMGYKRVITYTLEDEPGASLKASGFKRIGESGGGSWDVPSRPRELVQENLFGTVVKYSTQKKVRWEKTYK